MDVNGIGVGGYSLRPVAWEDREPIRHWRNAQIDILRQAEPLSVEAQARYYECVVRPQMDQRDPEQVLVAFLEHDRLIGYGGIVHIDWLNSRGEVSFITDTARQDPERLRVDLRAFLTLATELAERLGLHRLTTETYEFRDLFISELERAGYVREGRLREHVMANGTFIDSIVHGLLLRN